MLHHCSHSVTSSLQHHQFSVVHGNRSLDSPETGGTGRLKRERREGEWWRGNTDSFRENAKTEMQLHTAGCDAAKLCIHHSTVLLWAFASRRARHHTVQTDSVSVGSVLRSSIECSCAVWGAQRKGIAVKFDLLEFTSSSPVLPLSACKFATPDLIRPFGNGAEGSDSNCK